MNENTLVSVHGYAGDSNQVRFMLPYYLHHKCPVVIMSPVDSPITKALIGTRSGITLVESGNRAYIGQLSLDRQIEHMKELLKFPQHFFLMNDADSVCLSPQLPDYLYHEPDVLWSNIVSDAMHDSKRAADYKYPHLAFQPPYFCSRGVLEKLLTVADNIKADPNTPFIDWCMMAWAVEAGVPYKSFAYGHGVSCPSTTVETRYAMEGAVNNGAIFVHSIKQLEALKQIAYARIRYKKKHKIK